jgi:hypothetical protein
MRLVAKVVPKPLREHWGSRFGFIRAAAEGSYQGFPTGKNPAPDVIG